jgi:hypothetical protein
MASPLASPSLFTSTIPTFAQPLSNPFAFEMGYGGSSSSLPVHTQRVIETPNRPPSEIRSQIPSQFKIFPRPVPLRYIRANHNAAYNRKFEPYLNPSDQRSGGTSWDIDHAQWDFKKLVPEGLSDSEEESLVLDAEDIPESTASGTLCGSSSLRDENSSNRKKPAEVSQKSSFESLCFHEESEGYFTIPSKSALEGLDSSQLSNLKTFVVGKIKGGEMVGQIEWQNVDIRGVDFREIRIEPKMVEVYSNEFTKPSKGSKLNRQALIRLWKIWPTKRGHQETSPSKRLMPNFFEQSLRKRASEFNGKFVSYDAISGEWVFQVPNF